MSKINIGTHDRLTSDDGDLIALNCQGATTSVYSQDMSLVNGTVMQINLSYGKNIIRFDKMDPYYMTFTPIDNMGFCYVDLLLDNTFNDIFDLVINQNRFLTIPISFVFRQDGGMYNEFEFICNSVQHNMISIDISESYSYGFHYHEIYRQISNYNMNYGRTQNNNMFAISPNFQFSDQSNPQIHVVNIDLIIDTQENKAEIIPKSCTL